MDTAAPANDNPLAGIRNLLPAQPGTHVYPKDAAITGPIFRYDGSLASTVQMPPQFNRFWFVTDFNLSWVKAMKLTPDGRLGGDPIELFGGMGISKPLDFQQGPDGAFYLVNYSCGTWHEVEADACVSILRIEYSGACRDTKLRPDALSGAGQTGSAPEFGFRGGVLEFADPGGHALEIRDVRGRTAFSLSFAGKRSYRIAELLRGHAPGIYFLKAESGGVSRSWEVPAFGE